MNTEIQHAMHYLYLEGHTAKYAMNEIHSVYGGSYPSYSTAKRIFQKFDEPEIILSEEVSKKSSKKVKRIDAIQSALDENPNASLKLLAAKTQISKTTIWRTLVSDMGFVFQVPILTPHDLNSELKRKRVEKSIQLLKVLEDPKVKPNYIITGDEAWLQWAGRITGKWQKKDQTPPFSPRLPKTIKKTMIIVFFSFTEILVTDYLSQGMHNSSSHMCEYVWKVLDEKLRKKRPKSGAKNTFLHFDNSPIHKSKESMETINQFGFKLLENPPYSPDIAPSDFWLFGYIDGQRNGKVASSEEELISQTNEILAEIDKSILGSVYIEWINRLHKVIDSGGEYLLQ